MLVEKNTCHHSVELFIPILKNLIHNFSRLKSQYENELRELERAERLSRDKYTDCRSKLAESEASIQNLQATTKQLELQLSHLQKVHFCKQQQKYEKKKFHKSVFFSHIFPFEYDDLCLFSLIFFFFWK